MKKFFSLLLTVALVFSLSACSIADGNEMTVTAASGQGVTLTDAEGPVDELQTEEQIQTTEVTADGDVLVAYFSWAENAVLPNGEGEVNAVTSPSVLVPGNVQQLAGWVQEATGGDSFSIRVTHPYPSDWDECLERANEERGEDARPELMENVADLDQYDTIFLGYPNWWYGVPMALLSFLEQNDLSGKQVYLFCSHGTGGLAGSVEQITEAAPGAAISDNIFDCYEEEAASSEAAIKAWTEELGYGSQIKAEHGGQTETEKKAADMSGKRISVQFGDTEVIYELNDSTAANSLYEMLPLTVEVEDYSTNEKIFYPPEELVSVETPLAVSDTDGGTLAYYEPWGNVVMFYDGFNENSSLYELGYAVSGAEQISSMSGTITVEAIE